MRWSPIKTLLLITLLCGIITAVAPAVQANIPVKSICIKNDKDQPLLFNGQGIWVRQNNALGSLWFKQGDANGCAQFDSSKAFLAQYFTSTTPVDMNFDGNPDGPTHSGATHADMGCASGPFGFQVVMPKDWESQWSCESVGTTDGPFPCCRSNEDKKYIPNCNICPVHTLGYEGQTTSKQCFCDRSAKNGQADSECPICFHNDGKQIDITLHCKRTKTTDTKTLSKPEAKQFSSKANQALSCLNTELCSDTDPLRKCQPNTSTATGTRRVRLVGVKQRKQTLLPSQPTKPFWLVECIIEGASQDNASYLCTTGSSANDIKALGVDNFAKLRSTYGYTSTMYSQDGKAISQPIQSTQDLLDVYEWETTTAKLTSSVFMAVYDSDATGAATVGSSSGQQQATLSFEDACTLVQDPFGHVFDSHTLEPLPQASVEISQQDKAGTFQSLSKQFTGPDGRYSFYVNDGTYKIAAAKANYTFPGLAKNLDPRSGQFYTNLYHGEDIQQQGNAQQYDIPLDPTDKKAAEAFAQTNPIKILNYFQSVQKAEKNYVIEGQVTHPRSVIVVYANIPNTNHPGAFTRGRALKRTEADNSGYFRLIFPLSAIQQHEVVGELEATKRLNQMKDTVRLNPIMETVKGFAYDSHGSLVPGATVEVVTAVSDKPYFTTTADARGFFSIDAGNLPPVQASLRFVSLNKAVDTVSTRTFVATNNAAKGGKINTIAMNGNPNGDVLGISSSSETEEKPTLSTRVWFLVALLLAVLLASVYKVYIRK